MKKDPRILHSRIAALAAGVGVAVCAIALVFALIPAQSQVDENAEYGYVYSGVKSSSVDFVKANTSDESLLVFGSSEFSTPAQLVPQVPGKVFGETDYGMRLMLVGEAFDQSLWHAIALGAYGDGGVPQDKVAIIVAPGWFTDGGQDGETFKARFSYSLYRGFCANPQVPSKAKEYVRTRLEELGVDETQLNAADPTLPQDHLNNLAFGALDDLKLRQGLAEVRAQGTERVTSDTPATPDFEALRAEADETGAQMSGSNDWGIEDSFYEEQLAPVYEDIEGYRADETYSDTPEYDDLACFLDIADACGMEVLVVISPEMGPYYDYIGISTQTRKACYDRVRSIAAEHDAEIADFSDREYEKYFLYDIVHFGWTGWIDVEQSLYEFWRKGA